MNAVQISASMYTSYYVRTLASVSGVLCSSAVGLYICRTGQGRQNNNKLIIFGNTTRRVFHGFILVLIGFKIASKK